MPRQNVTISVNPGVLKWARETSGATVQEAAKRLKVPSATFSRWESAETQITLSQLRELAGYFKRPLAAFLLPSPPKEPDPPTDFRVLPGQAEKFSRKTRLSIRRAVRLRSVAKDLLVGIQSDARPSLEAAQLTDDPDRIASREREHLGVNLQEQFKWSDGWGAFREWRSAVEGRNVLVFQFAMPIEDARGFSLSDDMPFAVVVSSSDAPHARIFTLFHEYAHLVLRRPGICLPGSEPRSRAPEASVEKWCNRFAGALLVPEAALLSALNSGTIADPKRQLHESLAGASRLFKVSQQVVLRRMLDCHAISKAAFRKEMERLQAEAGRFKRGGGPVSPARKCLSENGRLFTSLVLEAQGRNLITYADVADYLSLRLKYLPEVQSSLERPAA